VIGLVTSLRLDTEQRGKCILEGGIKNVRFNYGPILSTVQRILYQMDMSSWQRDGDLRLENAFSGTHFIDIVIIISISSKSLNFKQIFCEKQHRSFRRVLINFLQRTSISRLRPSEIRQNEFKICVCEIQVKWLLK